jgi:glyoxylase-like metal-dependent hydrolase (beta-lactamase superfamily II)
VSGRFRTNCYFYGDENSKEVGIIDPGIDSNEVKSVVNREGYKPVYLIATHPHVIIIGEERLHVIETPGHTRNDVMLIDYKNRLIFTGDTLLRGRIPRQLINYNNLMASIRKILYYPKISTDFKIYPGHGGHSTIGKERLNY